MRVPPGLSSSAVALLLLVSLCSSMLTACMGAGGGLLLLAVMSNLLPPQALIAIHGVIQLGSNAGRSAMTLRHIDWRAIGFFIPGMIVGAVLAALIYVRLPPSVWQIGIALFVLYLCWGPPLPQGFSGPRGTVVMGAVTTFLSLFVGASGPLVSAFFKQLYSSRFTTLATMACALLLQHSAKTVTFLLTGFEFGAWMGFICGMIIAGAIGTWMGLKLLKKISDQRFRLLLNIILTLLALRLIYQAII